MAKVRKHQFVVTVTFDKECIQSHALREIRNCIHGEFYPDQFEDTDPGIMIVRGFKNMPKEKKARANDEGTALRAIIALAPATKPELDSDFDPSALEDGLDYDALAEHHLALGRWEAAEIARQAIASIDAE